MESAPLQGESILYEPVSKRFFVLNPTAAFVWGRLGSPVDVAALAAELCGAFQAVELDIAVRDVEQTLSQMIELSLVAAVEAPAEQ